MIVESSEVLFEALWVSELKSLGTVTGLEGKRARFLASTEMDLLSKDNHDSYDTQYIMYVKMVDI